MCVSLVTGSVQNVCVWVWEGVGLCVCGDTLPSLATSADT